jgi:nucleotide-binding universal stress UspA family protein
MNEIVVGVDGSEESRGALAWAVEEGRLRQAPVLAIHAWELPMVPAPSGLVPPSVEVAADLTELRQGSAELVESMVREIAGDNADVEVRPLAVEDGPVNALLAAAEQNDAQMIVVGSRGHGGFVALLIGSTSDQVARHATCPVLIHRQRRD